MRPSNEGRFVLRGFTGENRGQVTAHRTGAFGISLTLASSARIPSGGTTDSTMIALRRADAGIATDLAHQFVTNLRVVESPVEEPRVTGPFPIELAPMRRKPALECAALHTATRISSKFSEASDRAPARSRRSTRSASSTASPTCVPAAERARTRRRTSAGSGSSTFPGRELARRSSREAVVGAARMEGVAARLRVVRDRVAGGARAAASVRRPERPQAVR